MFHGESEVSVKKLRKEKKDFELKKKSDALNKLELIQNSLRSTPYMSWD